MESFEDIGVSEWLADSLNQVGILKPTPIQEKTIPAGLNGDHLVGIAHTGSGKTAAFSLPFIQEMAKDPYGIYALILTPTRELAIQI